MVKMGPEQTCAALPITNVQDDNRLDAAAHDLRVIDTTLPTTNAHGDVDIDVQAPPPVYTHSPPTDNIEMCTAQLAPTRLSHSDTARSMAGTTPPTFNHKSRPKKKERGGYLFILWFFLFFVFTLFMSIHLSHLMHGNPAYPLGFMAFFVVPMILSLIWQKISWYRMSPQERDRKKRLDDLKKLILKTKRLNGKTSSGETRTTGNEGREIEIVEQLRCWPQDEEWMKLVGEYDELQAEQVERGWLLRTPAVVRAAGPGRPVASATPTTTVEGAK